MMPTWTMNGSPEDDLTCVRDETVSRLKKRLGNLPKSRVIRFLIRYAYPGVPMAYTESDLGHVVSVVSVTPEASLQAHERLITCVLDPTSHAVNPMMACVVWTNNAGHVFVLQVDHNAVG